MSERIVVASTNPVKIQATLAGFQQMFPQRRFTIEGAPIPSGVDDQPSSDAETRQGAMNRALRARELHSTADFAVGIEGGIDRIDGRMFAFAWVVVHSPEQIGQARSGSFALPPQVQQLVEAGQELGTANDVVFDQHNSKQLGGAVGSLTGGVVSRQQLYQHCVVLALVPFQRSELFPTQ